MFQQYQHVLIDLKYNNTCTIITYFIVSAVDGIALADNDISPYNGDLFHEVTMAYVKYYVFICFQLFPLTRNLSNNFPHTSARF